MKALKSLGLAWLTVVAVSAHAQVYSQNIVGYANLLFYAGNNLIANQFGNGDNSLNTIFHGSIPQGSTFTAWDSAVQQYLPASVYNATSGWSINYSLGYGEGGLFNATAAFTNTFAGTVWPGYDGIAPFVPPLISGNGSLLLSCFIPIDHATFYDVVGRAPQNGDSVTTLNAATQSPTTTIYENGAWDNGAPELNIGQAAFFDQGLAKAPLNVPEPSTLALAGAGLLGLALRRRF